MTEPGNAGRYAAVAQALNRTAFASIEYVEETDSTNADAAALLGNPRFGGRTIVAEYQRKGTGRKGRSWEAPRGTGLLFSTILPRAIASELLWLVPFWVALAVRNALLEYAIITTLQWPNDVLLGKRKLAGILCQSTVTGAAARVACGVGINANRQPAGSAHGDAIAFCDDVAHVERGELLRSVLLEYQRSLSLLDLPDRVIADWDSAAALPGARYRIELDRGGVPFEAIAQGLAGDGGLRLMDDDGRCKTVSLADARVLR